MSVLQCFVCREWNWMVSEVRDFEANLCVPCYVDVLELRQRQLEVRRERGWYGLLGAVWGEGDVRAKAEHRSVDAVPLEPLPSSDTVPYFQIDLWPKTCDPRDPGALS